MKNIVTPLYDALMRHQQRQSFSFHVPGHKNGTVFPTKAKKDFQSLLSIDLTELPGLDDLHSPTSVIAEAQELLSSLYGSDRSYFLVGGSTSGNLAMLFATCTKGETVLVQRNCHRSILHGVRLAGARPVFLAPMIDHESGLATAPDLDTVREALEKFPEAKALVLTHPNYYGMAVDIRPLIEQAHEHNVPVLADEAHGAHFTLGPPFPESAIACGADAVVQSAHKTLPAMTMGAFMHVQGTRINREALEEKLGMLQSSSPSYPIMASLDLARAYVAQLTAADLTAIHEDIERIRNWLDCFPQFEVMKPSSDAYTALDPLKITLQTRCSLNGFQLQHRLEGQGIDTELADPYHVLFVLPLARFEDEDRFIEKVEKALASVGVTESPSRPNHMDMPRVSRPIEIAQNYSTKVMPLHKAAGFISAQEVTPYPPGVPLLVRGEAISASQIIALQDWFAAGGRFQTGSEIFTAGICVVPGEYSYDTMKDI